MTWIAKILNLDRLKIELGRCSRLAINRGFLRQDSGWGSDNNLNTALNSCTKSFKLGLSLRDLTIVTLEKLLQMLALTFQHSIQLSNLALV